MGCWIKTLCTVIVSLVILTAEYCKSIWCHSARTRFVDSVLNDKFRVVTGWLCIALQRPPTHTFRNLATDFQRLRATVSLGYLGTLDFDHMLQDLLSRSSDAYQMRLRPFVPKTIEQFC